MKTHLVKFHGGVDWDFFTSTYCGLNSDNWSEEVNNSLTRDVGEVTCKSCILNCQKDIRRHDELMKNYIY